MPKSKTATQKAQEQAERTAGAIKAGTSGYQAPIVSSRTVNGGIDTSGLPDPGSGSGSGSGGTKQLTPKEIAAIRKRQEQELREHLSGPWTKESILGQYSGTVANILGNQHPKAEQFATFAMNQKMDQDTFSGWLRARPEYLGTEGYRNQVSGFQRMIAELFGGI